MANQENRKVLLSIKDLVVKFHVRGEMVLSRQNLRLDNGALLIDTDNVRVRRPFRRQRRDPRLHLQADFQKVTRQFQPVPAERKAERVFDLPRLVCDKGTLSSPDFQHMARRQKFHRFAHRAAPNVKLFAQFKLVGQFLPPCASDA